MRRPNRQQTQHVTVPQPPSSPGSVPPAGPHGPGAGPAPAPIPPTAARPGAPVPGAPAPGAPAPGAPAPGTAAPAPAPGRRRGRAIGFTLAAALLIFVTVVLVLFVVFNTQSVDISLVFGNVRAPLVLALVVAAALGGLVVGLSALALRSRRSR